MVIGRPAPLRCKAADAENWASTFCANYTSGGAIGTCAWIDFSAALDGDTAATRACLTFAVSTLKGVDHLILARQPDKRSPEAPPELAELFDVLESSPEPLLANSDLAYCPRTKLAPTLSVRGACVEDSDDLLPIFQSQSEVLAEHFGDFFLAEIIENADENNKQLVAVAVDDHAVRLLSASTDIDVATLGACFELEPFGNLVKGSSSRGEVPSEQPADAPAAAPAPATPPRRGRGSRVELHGRDALLPGRAARKSRRGLLRGHVSTVAGQGVLRRDGPADGPESGVSGRVRVHSSQGRLDLRPYTLFIAPRRVAGTFFFECEALRPGDSTPRRRRVSGRRLILRD